MNILHLSDLHINPNTLDDFEKIYLSKFVEHTEQFGKIDLLFITGDIIHQGGKSFNCTTLEALKKAKEKVLDVLEANLNIDKHSVFIIPGNHDIDRNADSLITENGMKQLFIDQNKVRNHFFEKKLDEIEGVERIKAFSTFNSNFYFDYPNKKHFCLGSSFIKYINNLSIGISCLNSAWRCYSDEDKGNIILGEQQVIDNHHFIKDCDIKIALLHHQPCFFKEFESEYIESFLNNNYDFVFLGHTHKSVAYSNSFSRKNTIWIVSPSSYINLREPDYRYRSGYTICQLKEDSSNIKYFYFSHNNGEYRTNTEKGENGINVFDSIFKKKGKNEVNYKYKIQIDDQTDCELFYNGFVPKWGDLKRNYDIGRHVYNKPQGIKEKIEKNINENKTTIILLRGAAGTGKSSLLKRIAYDFDSSREVYFLNNELIKYDQIDIVNFLNSLNITKNGIVIIDDFLKLIKDTNSDIYKLKLNLPFLIVSSSHPNLENEMFSENLFANKINYTLFDLHSLTKDECLSLVQKLSYLEENNLIEKKNEEISKEKREELVLEYLNKQLVVALLVLRYGLNFKQIIINEYNSIPSQLGKSAYIFVCLSDILDLPINPQLLYEKLDIKNQDLFKIKEINHSLKNIVLFKNGCQTRHKIVSRIIIEYAIDSCESKAFLLEKLLEGSTRKSLLYSQDFFSKYNAQKIISLFLENDFELIEDLYKNLLFQTYDNKLKAYIYGVFGLFYKSKRNYDEAIDCYNEYLSYFPNNSFAYRQLAWIFLEDCQFEKAEEFAYKAVNANNDYQSNIHCAEILSMCTVETFKDAEKFYLRAQELAEYKNDFEKKYVKYQNAKKVLAYFNFSDNEIPDDVIKELKPSIQLLHSFYGQDNSFFRGRLMLKLSKNLQGYYEDDLELKEMLDNFHNNNYNNKLKAKLYSNIARYLFNMKYKYDVNINDAEIEEKLNISIKLNNNDAFTYTWYGTYLKEIKNDINEAEKKYRQAITVSESSEYIHDKRHPLLLNNLALLLTSKLEKYNLHNDKKLQIEINDLYLEAISKSKEYNFFWPEINYSYYKELSQSVNKSE